MFQEENHYKDFPFILLKQLLKLILAVQIFSRTFKSGSPECCINNVGGLFLILKFYTADECCLGDATGIVNCGVIQPTHNPIEVDP